MINGKKIIAVLPAYNAALTLKQTYDEIPFDIVDDVVLVDDHSKDNTSEVARQIGIQHVIRHEQNKGYGGNNDATIHWDFFKDMKNGKMFVDGKLFMIKGKFV